MKNNYTYNWYTGKEENSFILNRSGQFKVTFREVLLSTVILCLMVGLGIIISGKILYNSEEDARKVVSSVQIETPYELDYSIRTDVGDFLAEGNLEAIDSVSIQDIPGYYMYIKKCKEEYTRHVQTYVVSNGKTSTLHTRVYYSWDVVHTDKYKSDSLAFLEYPMTVDIPSCKYNCTIKKSMDTRYVYYTTPTKVYGVVSGTIENHQLTGKFERDTTIQELVDKASKNINGPVILFWVIWIIFTLAIIVQFYWGEYEWLERN